MPTDYPALSAALRADQSLWPAARPLVEGDAKADPVVYASDDGAAGLLNDPGRGYTHVVPMRVGDFGNWLAGRGLLRKISDARTHANDTVASIALLLMYKLQGDPNRMVDPADPSTRGMFQAFVAAGLATADDVAALTEACTGPCGWFESRTGRPCTAEDVRHLR